MESFATVEQYMDRFPGDVDDVVIQECLDDASAAIRAALYRAGIDWTAPTEEYADRLMRVCRSVANRIMPAGGSIPVGATQLSVTSGDYNENVSFSPGYGTPKLLPSERDLLGIRGGGRMLYPTSYAWEGQT